MAKRVRTLSLGAAADHERAGTNAGLHLRALEVDDVAVVEEEVCLLDTGHSVALELLEDALEALVFVAGGLVHGLLLAADRTSATGTGRLTTRQAEWHVRNGEWNGETEFCSNPEKGYSPMPASLTAHTVENVRAHPLVLA